MTGIEIFRLRGGKIVELRGEANLMGLMQQLGILPGPPKELTMPGNEQDGYYCTICGGIPPDQIKIRKIPVDGKETGIDRLDWILLDVLALALSDEEKITDEIVKRVRQFNYIPGKKEAEYRKAFLREYRMLAASGVQPDKK